MPNQFKLNGPGEFIGGYRQLKVNEMVNTERFRWDANIENHRLKSESDGPGQTPKLILTLCLKWKWI